MSCLIACLVLCSQGLELKGAVTGPDGQAISGASVFVSRARPRRGIGTL